MISRGVAQPGRASALGAESPLQFPHNYLHFHERCHVCENVAKLGRLFLCTPFPHPPLGERCSVHGGSYGF